MSATLERRAAMLAKSLALAASIAATGDLRAQTKAPQVPDAQVESNVLKALASNSKLADQRISSAAVYGVVTLSGHVADEGLRSLAEDVVSRTAGVQKVVDELTIGGDQASSAAVTQATPADQGQNGQLQSDGTYAPAGAPPSGEPPLSNQPQANETPIPPTAATQGAPDPWNGPAGPPPPDAGYGDNQPRNGQGGYGQINQSPYGAPQGAPAPGGNQPPYGQGQPSYPQAGQDPYSQQGPPAYGGNAQQPPYGPNGQPPYGPPSQSPYGQPGAPPQRPYASGYGSYVGQPGGEVVSVPAGATLQLRLDTGIDSRHAQIGSAFSGTVIRDVVAGGYIAIPRGATVQGTVVDATSGGALKGHASLALQLTQVTFGGRTYPLSSTVWQGDGLDKTGRTVGSAVGLGVVGAIIGGVAGGGAGAAIGAGAGGAAGIGASAASGNPQVVLPPESVVTFQLSQPVTLTTVSQGELERLAYGMPYGGPPQVRRRYPPPPPYYYGPGYYYAPRAYYRPYPY